ncbi:hypothetical protein HPB52_014306 [Rhipicephalus sanguineus]|uniref:Glucose-methanol-choline oxidoreductase C-terminal domain-containing protein n=1 Tax=Rhipicephalus sanguineus TaxID=34632 RepID=A0A9D4SSW9_RHISA|nr:hypothetical protein HPB52_014306 [Rhipicephalus sanguineus]
MRVHIPKAPKHLHDLFVSLEVHERKRLGAKKFIDSMLNPEAMKSIGVKPWNVTFPPCAKAGSQWSEEYIACLFEHFAQTVWHICCTVAMGAHPEAVVDERLSFAWLQLYAWVLGARAALRVRGEVTGLGVADASVMPEIVAAHTNGPSMTIGSKAAAVIIEDCAGVQ